MARKLVVSVLRRVVGVRREALVRLRIGRDTRPSGLRWGLLEVVEEFEGPEPCGLGKLDEVTVVVTAVASETRSPNIIPDARRPG